MAMTLTRTLLVRRLALLSGTSFYCIVSFKLRAGKKALSWTCNSCSDGEANVMIADRRGKAVNSKCSVKWSANKVIESNCREKMCLLSSMARARRSSVHVVQRSLKA